MLSRRLAVKGSAQLASPYYYITPTGRLVRPRGRHSLPSQDLAVNIAFRTVTRRYTFDAMLRGAVQKHEKENQTQSVLGKTLAQSLFSSSPPAQQLKPTAAKSVSAGFQNVLKPSPPSNVNQMRPPSTAQPRQYGGIKRTASGLRKVMDGTFEEDAGNVRGSAALNGSKAPQEELYEDDFDSDIELDIEEPKFKGNIQYPSLPSKQTAPSTTPAAIIRPTQPRQQQAQTHYHDSGYGSIEPSTIPPGSSAPLPWSSSPAEHLEPTKDVAAIRRFVYGGEANAQAQHNGAAQQQPPKRRTLPWADTPVEEAGSRPRSAGTATPAPKITRKSNFNPWNTTASAIKDQQRKFREEQKKAVRKNEGTAEDVLKAKTKRKQVARVFLSEEQQHVLDLVVEQKKSAFFTGSAGTGKSVLLREIISSLRKKYAREPDRIAVTASTGLAACNVGGVTLHSFAGIGLGKEDASELVRKIKKNQKARHRWMRTKVLVIDEVSMVDAELFDKLENIARQLRNNGRPFGGIQLIITGDFFQLPPVPDSGKVAKFAFDAGTWNTTIEYTIGLHHVFRQKDPGTYICLFIAPSMLIIVHSICWNAQRDARGTLDRRFDQGFQKSHTRSEVRGCPGVHRAVCFALRSRACKRRTAESTTRSARSLRGTRRRHNCGQSPARQAVG
jgi:ATP-dependent DNA helicase PIF1